MTDSSAGHGDGECLRQGSFAGTSTTGECENRQGIKVQDNVSRTMQWWHTLSMSHGAF
ncbi:hypothetical protein [Streptomyces anulatus]|uniref:hypothetical protein n=1 Tax=Streptomyces anulatus TaxID=1892 RepID=UPI002F915060